MLAEQIFHTSSAYLLRKGLGTVLSTKSNVLDLVNQVIQSGSPVNDYHVPIITSWQREERIVDIYAAPLADHDDLVILTFRDRGVSDRIDRQLGYRSAARSVTGLASMLAHEIKNPLSGIRGAAQLLGDVVSNDDKKLAELITSETDRIVKIVDRMEVFSNDTPLQSEAVNLHAVLSDVRRLAQSGFASNIVFTEDYDPSLPLAAGSKDELIQVFLNLIKNAAEELNGKPDGKIRLHSSYRSGVRFSSSNKHKYKNLPLVFNISDNGGGIPDEILSHIFDPFVTTKINGSGLGLAMVARIIERHGGVIECSSNSEGTTFSILLPAWTEQANANTIKDDMTSAMDESDE